ncbi:uncharacterized protein LOC136082354 isoform X1 [Hydra vulgaris]|uniref:Uncharacterized protein LOC136082354 isoform X1 n=1 Tax=Hydra vulgaris TaxID=6087 RepID=A0ABM4C774_HYDVU
MIDVILDDQEIKSAINFKKSDSEDDSDAMQLFELPKRKVIRPLSSATKRKLKERHYYSETIHQCLKVICNWAAPFLIALFIVSTSLCLMFLLSGITSMKQELNLLQIRLKNADNIQSEFNIKNEQLRKEYSDKLFVVDQYKIAFNGLADKINTFTYKIDALNNSIIQTRASISSPLLNQVALIINDVDTLKTGMADTGSKIEQLTATSKAFDRSLAEYSSMLDMFKAEMFNLTASLDKLKSLSQIFLTTDTTSVEEKPATRKELRSALEALSQSQIDLIQNNTKFFEKELEILNKSCIDLVKNVFTVRSIDQQVFSSNNEDFTKLDNKKNVTLVSKFSNQNISTTNLQNVTGKANFQAIDKFGLLLTQNSLKNLNIESKDDVSNKQSEDLIDLPKIQRENLPSTYSQSSIGLQKTREDSLDLPFTSFSLSKDEKPENPNEGQLFNEEHALKLLSEVVGEHSKLEDNEHTKLINTPI